jgi:hypothetical protein
MMGEIIPCPGSGLLSYSALETVVSYGNVTVTHHLSRTAPDRFQAFRVSKDGHNRSHKDHNTKE